MHNADHISTTQRGLLQGPATESALTRSAQRSQGGAGVDPI